MKYDIIGIGGPILDQILPVSETFLKKVPGKKGGAEPITFEILEKIISESGSKPVSMLGGCARNTLHGLTKLGEKCALYGMVGKDARGKIYKKHLKEQGIYPLLIESDTPTALVLSCVTPDGERTMRTFQGASIEIRGRHLEREAFKNVKLVHIEGYAFYNDDLVETATHFAKQAGARISLDLASPELISRFKSKILHVLEKGIDIIFANEEEAFALTGEKHERFSSEFLGNFCDTAVILMGQKGCFIKQKAFRSHFPAYPVEPLDTTGAGDLFESGFLHGILQEYPLEVCAHMGAVLGRAVVQVMGAFIPKNQWDQIFNEIRVSDKSSDILEPAFSN